MNHFFFKILGLDQTQYMINLKRDVRNILLDALHSIVDGIVKDLQYGCNASWQKVPFHHL